MLEWHALSRALLPALEGSGTSRGWLDQFLLFRNKLVHYGPSGFMLSLGLYDANRNVFTFLPRDWPQLPEQFITPSGSPPPRPEEPSGFERACLEEDLVEYSVGLHSTVRTIINLIFDSLSLSYDVLTGMPTPRGLEQAFFKARVTTSFQHF